MALPKKAKITSAVLLLAVAIGCVLYLNRPESSASSQSTKDAYVQADFTFVAPQIAGKVDQVFVEENQQVKAGDLLATIDDRDFVVAVDAAKAQVSGANASVASLEARLAQQQNAIHQAQAAVAMDKAELVLARANHERYRNLAADGSGTVQAMQQAQSQLNIRLASQEKNQAGLKAAQQQVAILQAELEKAKAALAQAQAAQAAAELKLSYTRITAPVDGTVGQKSVRVGAFVNTGTPLLAIVPLDAVYIQANYRETQLAHIQIGQTVDIKVDALPGATLKGTVESLGPASGVSYSAIAPHNATGNFTKIVQRLPLRIRVDSGQPEANKLRVGMSVVPTIQTRN
ncbi:MAG: HlyD family secretion protein [Shewanella indica]|jgi:membrane fusion protein (multidrug efflux system)|uniref:HlyD family secretion protein n=1 Tax=Shewanella indica TaxID=768528 RepID=UPI000C1180A7|nr:HlyD family secretion protein [uncultured Halomonas sp.]MDY0213420.1 HlyD family secretion protein [Desulfuromonadaceae bacterium]PHR02354.1 MAG: efflux transporter periplasmic adaptor subunit [Halomonas sp.]